MTSGQLTTRPACPYCGMTVDAWSATVNDDSVRPSAGDVSICVGCLNLMAFTESGDELTLRALTIFEHDEAIKLPEIENA